MPFLHGTTVIEKSLHGRVMGMQRHLAKFVPQPFCFASYFLERLIITM